MSEEICFFSHLSVPLAPPKLLTFDNKNEKNTFHFVLCSLNRTIGSAEVTFVRQNK